MLIPALSTCPFYQDFSSSVAINEAHKGAMIHDVKVNPNSSITGRELGINHKRVAIWVRHCWEILAVAKVREPSPWALPVDLAGKQGVKQLLDGKHGGANRNGHVLQSKG